MIGDVSLGVPGSLGAATIARVAPLVEAAGYAGLWVNDTRDGDSIAALAAAAATTTRLRLNVGVVPIDRRPPSDILAAIRRHDVPATRLTIGIGAGAPGRGSLDRVADAIAELREGAPEAAVVVGALGPRMRALAATRSDGVLLNWVPTTAVASQASEVRSMGIEARGTAPRVIVYARAIVDDEARPALEAEAARYAAVPAYAAHFARLGITPDRTTLPRPGEDSLALGARDYLESVDELVLRAITRDGTPEQLASFVERAARAMSAARSS